MKTEVTQGQIDSQTYFIQHRTIMSKDEYIAWVRSGMDSFAQPQVIGVTHENKVSIPKSIENN